MWGGIFVTLCIKQMGKWWQSVSTFLPQKARKKRKKSRERLKRQLIFFLAFYIKMDANPRKQGAWPWLDKKDMKSCFFVNQTRCAVQKKKKEWRKSPISFLVQKYVRGLASGTYWKTDRTHHYTTSSDWLQSYSGLRVHHSTAFCHFTTHAALSSEGGFHFSASKVHSGIKSMNIGIFRLPNHN